MVALAFVVWRVTGEARVERQQMSAFMHGVIDRIQTDDVTEVAKADAIREASKMADDMQVGAESVLETKIAEHMAMGFADPHEAHARVLMEQSGLDPDNDSHIQMWNDKHSGKTH